MATTAPKWLALRKDRVTDRRYRARRPAAHGEGDGGDALIKPEAPVMVTVEVPAAAPGLAVNVSTLDLAVGLVANAALTPVGRPDAVSVTFPANGLTSVTVMVSVYKCQICNKETKNPVDTMTHYLDHGSTALAAVNAMIKDQRSGSVTTEDRARISDEAKATAQKGKVITATQEA